MSIYNFKKAAKVDPKNPEIIKALADAYGKNGELEKSVQTMRDYCTIETDSLKKVAAEDEIRKTLRLIRGERPSAPVAAPVQAVAETVSTTPKSAAAPEKPAIHTEKPAVIAPQPRKLPAGDAFTLVVNTQHTDVSNDPVLKPVIEFYNNGLYGNALKAVRDILKNNPDHAGAYYYGGLIRYYNNEPEKALFNLKRGSAYAEKSYAAHFYLGLIYEEMGKKQDALREFGLVLSSSPDGPERTTAQQKVDALLKMGAKPATDLKEPCSPFKFKTTGVFSFIVEDTLSLTGRKMLGALDKFLDGRYDAALTDLKEIYRDNPKNSLTDNALYNIGLVYSAMRLWDEAVTYLDLVRQKFSNGDVAGHAEVLRGHVLVEKEALDNAVGVYEAFLIKSPSTSYYAFINTELGNIAFLRNDSENALKYYLKALGKENNHGNKTDLYYKIGECYRRQGSNRGIEYFVRAATDTASNIPAVMEACFRLGDYYYSVKNMEYALKYYKIAADRFPESKNVAWSLYQMGNIYRNGRQYDKAIKTFDALINSFPDDYWALQAKWRRDDAIWENQYRDILK